MSDIFISYASSDRGRAQLLADALTTQGWFVWWDRAIPPGKSFAKVIEAALDDAKCVIVLWSEASVSSEWVQTEAAEGARRQILVPALLEAVKIPLEFRRIQAANLSDWRGELSDPEFGKLLKSIRTCLGTSTSIEAKLEDPKIPGSVGQPEVTSQLVTPSVKVSKLSGLVLCILVAVVIVSTCGLLTFAGYIQGNYARGFTPERDYFEYLTFFTATAGIAASILIGRLRATKAVVASIAGGALLNLALYGIPFGIRSPIFRLDVLTLCVAGFVLAIKLATKKV